MKVGSKKTNFMVLVLSSFRTEIDTLEIGFSDKRTDGAFIVTHVEQNMLENGAVTRRKTSDVLNSQAAPGMKEILNKTKNMGKASL